MNKKQALGNLTRCQQVTFLAVNYIYANVEMNTETWLLVGLTSEHINVTISLFYLWCITRYSLIDAVKL